MVPTLACATSLCRDRKWTVATAEWRISRRPARLVNRFFANFMGIRVFSRHAPPARNRMRRWLVRGAGPVRSRASHGRMTESMWTAHTPYAR